MHFTMPVSKILTNRQIVDHYYVKTDKEHIFKCLCGAERKQKTENGYHNLISHLKSQHPGFENAIEMASNQQYTITDFVPTKITTIYSWYMLGVPLIGKAVQKDKLDINICFRLRHFMKTT